MLRNERAKNSEMAFHRGGYTPVMVLHPYRELFTYGMADEGREAFLATLERAYLPGETKESP